MKFMMLPILFLYTMQSYAIDESSPVGVDSVLSDFSAQVYESFQLKDGTIVKNSSQITGLYFSTVWLGGSKMTMAVDGKEQAFRLPKRDVYIQKNYAMTYIDSAADSTGQGLAVKSNNTPVGEEYTYEEVETSTCYSEPFDVCLRSDSSVCRYNVTASGTEEELVEYSEQDYRAEINLTDAVGVLVATLGYNTKDFNSRTLYTVSACNAEDNVRSKRRAVRKELRRLEENKKAKEDEEEDTKKPKKPRKRKH